MKIQKEHLSFEFVNAVLKKNPLHKSFISQAWELLDEKEKNVFDSYLDYYLTQGKTLTFIVDSYNLFIRDTMKEQIYFRRNGTYRYSKLEDALAKVYMNHEFMEKYMTGLIVSNFIWPNHVSICRWFHEKFPRNKKGRHLEVGPGHGYFFIEAMKNGDFDRYDAVDISPECLKLVESLIRSGFFGSFGNYRLINEDFLNNLKLDQYDSIVMGEVIEHVERPLDFLVRTKNLSKSNSFIFLTTAINAPEIDHIYLFDSVESVLSLINKAELKIKDTLILPYHGTSLERSEREKLPINIALELTT